MEKSKVLLTFIFFFLLVGANAQLRFVYLTDKNESVYSLSNPQEFLTEKSIKRRSDQNIPLTYWDLPVSQSYLEQINAQGGKVVYASKWVNGALVDASDEAFLKIKELPFVRHDKEIVFSRRKRNSLIKGKNTKSLKIKEENYGASLVQNQMLGIDEMHNDGFTGKGKIIAVLDAGFNKADQLPVFEKMFQNDHVVATYDFVNKEKEVFEDDSHGMQVLSAIGGYLDSALVGGAHNADYILLKTEDVSKETRLEEIYWLVGAEFADSLGADILTSSLGYNFFDNPNDNYSLEDLDGNTALITHAADYAASIGMLVVVSVGNEGNDDWGTLTFPADGDSVLAVGAVNANREYASFSSRGNTSDKRIKPDVMALGVGTTVAKSTGGVTKNNGTSFSSPLITALAAGLWEAFPDLTNIELLNLIRQSGSNATSPDSLIGYGIPNYKAAKELQINGFEDMIKGETIVFPNPLNESSLIIKDSNYRDSESIKVELYSTNAKALKDSFFKADKGQIILNEKFLSSLHPGTYYLRINSRKGKVFKKLIKQ